MRRVALAACVAAAAPAWGQTPQIHLLTGPGEVHALGTSADGRVVVGSAREAPAGRSRWFRWTLADGVRWVGADDDSLEDVAFSVSGDGTTIVGRSRTTAHFWTEAEGAVDLGPLDDTRVRTTAYGSSFDGSVIVGSAGSGNSSWGFVWRESTGMVELGGLNGPDGRNLARDITADGETVIGRVDDGARFQPARWTESAGWEILSGTPDWNVFGQGHAVSSDGEHTVGFVTAQGGPRQAARWRASTGEFELLGQDFNPESDFFALDVTDDGSMIVGLVEIDPNATDRAVVWDAANGTRLLSDVLENDYAIDLTGWTLLSAEAVSRDGTVITGEARFEGINYTVSYVAVIPAPATAAPLAALAAVGRRRRGRAVSP